MDTSHSRLTLYWVISGNGRHHMINEITGMCTIDSHGTRYSTAWAKWWIAILTVLAAGLNTPQPVASQTAELFVYGGPSIRSAEDYSMWEGGLAVLSGGYDVAQRLGFQMRMAAVGHNYYVDRERVDKYFSFSVGFIPEYSLIGRHGLSQQFRLFLLAGPNVAWSERNMVGLDDDNRFDAGLTSGVGVNLPLTERVALHTGLEYYLGLIQHDPYDRDAAFIVNFGLGFRWF